MNIPFTVTQKQRLIELGARSDTTSSAFPSEEQRDLSFKTIHNQLASENKQRLQALRRDMRRPMIRTIESVLVESLNRAGFVEVLTPIILSKGMLTKMGIKEGHPLLDQIYWLDDKTCLRPMHAPNLYFILGHLERLWPMPIRIFEVGPCFRKESKGARHLSEFTMLNVVEMGIEGDPQNRLEELAQLLMEALDLEYALEREDSEVYGNTTDVTVEDLEIASGAIGPHPLDANWNIADNWAGLGIGLERLVMVKEGFENIRRSGRSLIYLDGARLNV